MSTTLVKLDSGSVGYLEGKLLTIVDASVSDSVQRKAMKDLISSGIWEWASDWRSAFTEEQWKKNQEDHTDGSASTPLMGTY